MDWSTLIGKQIVALRGHENPLDSHAMTPLTYILFDDNETFIELVEQDLYDYHDCNTSARTLTLCKNAKRWKEMFDKVGGFAEPDGLRDPF